MAFFEKLGDIAKNLGDKTGDAIETTKLNSEISSKKREVSQLKQKIGDYFYEKHKMGELVDLGGLEFFTEVDALMLEVNELQAEIDKIKGENEQKQAPVPGTPLGIKCSNCARVNEVGKKFCSECGTKLEEEVVEKRYCGSCGAEVEPGLKFCGECGVKVEESQE